MTNEMGETPDIRELQMRIVELENKLAQMSRSGQTVNLTPEDLQAYAKVRDMLATGLACVSGCISECKLCINLCRCFDPIDSLCRCLTYPCLTECACGPCNIYDIGSGYMGGGGRFGGLGR